MAIVNRDKDPSEQLEVLSYTLFAPSAAAGSFSLGATYQLGNLPFPCEIKKIEATANSLSGAPSIEVEIYKFVAGAGVTINSSVMAAMVVPAFGTSGIAISASLGVAGSTQVQAAAQDQLVAVITGANTAVIGNLTVNVVVKRLQDIVSFYGATS